MILGYFAIGAALGAVTGMPVGAVGLTIMDAASRHPLRRAVGVAVGAGTGDMLWAAIGILGIGPLLANSPVVRPWLYAASGVALIGYGAFRLRAPRMPPVAGARTAAPRAPGHGRTGFALGLGLVLASPASLVTWVAIIGLFLGHAARPEAIAAVVGIWIGSAGWFAVLAHIARRGTRLLGERMAWVPHVAGVLLIGHGLLSLARGARYWIAAGLM